MLAPGVRFAALDEHLRRYDMALQQADPQVFPARPEPARAWWASESSDRVAVFRYMVNPDRRTVDLEGADVAAVADSIRAELGEIDPTAIAESLRSGPDEAAFTAAFLLAASAEPDAVELLSEALVRRDDYVAVGVLRAMELLGDPTVVPLLRAVRADGSRAGEVRLLAGEIAAAIAGSADLH